MVLAAGLGTRLRPLTLLRAKPVLPVLNRPLLHWTLELLARQGFKDVVINLHHLPESVTRRVGDGRAWGIRVSWSREAQILGTAGGIREVRGRFGREPVLVVNGDVLFDFDLRALVERHQASGAWATLALLPNPDPAVYGPVVTAPDGRVRSLAGLPRPARGQVSLFTGIHVLDPRILDRLPRGRSETVRDLYAPLIEAGEPVMGVRVRGRWHDLGAPRPYLESQLALLRAGFLGRRQRSLVDPGADVRGIVSTSVVGKGAVVDSGARVERSVLWEGARVGAGARVRRCIVATGGRVAAGVEVEDEVVMPEGFA